MSIRATHRTRPKDCLNFSQSVSYRPPRSSKVLLSSITLYTPAVVLTDSAASTTTASQRSSAAATSSGAPAPLTNRVTAANPFYDNIRQHVELADGITERIPLYIPKKILKRANELPFEWLKDITQWAGYRLDPPGSSDHVGSGAMSNDGSLSSSRSSSRFRTSQNLASGMEALAMV